MSFRESRYYKGDVGIVHRSMSGILLNEKFDVLENNHRDHFIIFKTKKGLFNRQQYELTVRFIRHDKRVEAQIYANDANDTHQSKNTALKLLDELDEAVPVVTPKY